MFTRCSRRKSASFPHPLTHSPTHPTTVISCRCILVVEFFGFFFCWGPCSSFPGAFRFSSSPSTALLLRRFLPILCFVSHISPHFLLHLLLHLLLLLLLRDLNFTLIKSSSVFLLDSLSLFCLSSVFFLFLRCEVQWGFLMRSFVVFFQQAQDRVVGLLL